MEIFVLYNKKGKTIGLFIGEKKEIKDFLYKHPQGLHVVDYEAIYPRRYKRYKRP